MWVLQATNLFAVMFESPTALLWQCKAPWSLENQETNSDFVSQYEQTFHGLFFLKNIRYVIRKMRTEVYYLFQNTSFRDFSFATTISFWVAKYQKGWKTTSYASLVHHCEDDYITKLYFCYTLIETHLFLSQLHAIWKLILMEEREPSHFLFTS